MFDAATLDNIISILDYTLLGLFIAFFVVLVLAFLRGLFRGWRYATYRLVFFTLFVVLAFLTARPLAQMVGTMDISSFGLPALNFSLNVDGTTINVSAAWTTPLDTIASVADQILRGMDIDMNPADLVNYSYSLALSLITIILLFADAILIAIFGTLFIWIMWHLAFKRFIKKNKRKASYKKGKLMGGLLNAVTCFVCLTLAIFPLTSIINGVNSGWNKAKENSEVTLKTVDNDFYNDLDQLLKTYDESIFAQAFFNWSRNADGKTFDTVLIDFLTNIETGGVSAGFLNELSNFVEAGNYIVQSGIIGKAGVQETALISFVTSSLAPLTLRALNNSSLVSSILPSAVTIAVNLPMIAEYVKVDTGIDYMKDFNYTATIDDLIDIYDSVIQSGYLDELTDDQGNLIQNDQLIQTTLSDQFYTTFIDIFESLDKEEMKFFDTMIEAVTLNLAFKASKEQPIEGSQIGLSDAAGFFPPLPEDIDADNNGYPDYIPGTYKDMKWGHEVSLVYSSLIKFITLDPAFLVQFVTQDEAGLVIRMDKLLELIADHPAEAEMIFTGKQVAAAPQVETTEEGEETADPYENLGLLDSVFINYGWNEILDLADKFLGDMGQGSEGGLSFNLDLSEIRNTLLKKDTETDFTGQISRMKSEFHSLFGVINAFVSVPEGKNFFVNLKTMPGFYFDPTGQYLGADEGLMDAFTAALRKLDDSVIARTIMPQAFDQLLTGENGILKDLDFDLKFDFSDPDLDIGNSLADIIVTYNQSQDFVTFMMSGISTDLSNSASLSNFVSELASYSDDLKSFLTLFATNPLLNSEIDGVKNYNFASIFDFLVKDLFNEEIADRIHSYIVSPDFNASLEVSSFVDVFVDVADSDVLSVINSDTLDFSALESINFETLFSRVDNSGIMKIALAGMLDDKILTMDIFKDVDCRISFENVKSWADEGKNLNIIIRSAGEIGDLNNIDVFNSDAQAVGNIIESLSQSSIFLTEDNEYLFNGFISDLFINNAEGNKSIAKYLGDEGATTYNTLENNINSITREEWPHQADILVDIVHSFQLKGLGDMTEDLDLSAINPSSLEDLLLSSNESAIFHNLLIPNTFSQLATALTKNGFESFSGINDKILWTADNDVTVHEIENLINIVDVIHDPVYGFIDENGNIDMNFNITEINVDYTLEPFLNSFANSYVFNTVEEGSTETLSAFEKEYAALLSESGIYGTTPVSEIEGYVKEVTKPAVTADDRFVCWDNEIHNILGALREAQNASLDLADFDIANFFEGDPEESRVTLENILDSINNSTTLYRALPLKIDEAISTIGNNLSGLDLTLANVHYNGDAPYGKDEIRTLSYIFKEAMTMGTIDFNNFQLADIPSGQVTNLLSYLANSHIFNSKIEGKSMTVFQDTYQLIFSNPSLGKYYFSENSDKDAHAISEGYYTNSNEKAVYYATKLFGEISPAFTVTDINEPIINGETDSLKSIIELLADPTLESAITNGDLSALEEADINSLLSAVNDCELTKDLLPNIIDDAIANNSDLLASDINLKQANSFFVYYMDPLHPDYEAAYPASEITNLSRAIYLIYDSSTLFSNFTTGTAISLDDLSVFENLFDSLLESEVFHGAGARNPSSTITSLGAPDDMTVFEQVMYMLYDKTGLAQRAYNASIDEAATYQLNLHSRIKGMSDGTLASMHAGKWTDEIHNLFNPEEGIFSYLLNQDLYGEGIDFDTINFNTLNPTVLSNVLYKFNALDIVSPAVGYETDKLLNNSLKFNDYTVLTVDGQAHNGANYLLNQQQYQDSGIPAITLAINVLWDDSTNSYTALSENLVQEMFSNAETGASRLGNLLHFINYEGGFFEGENYALGDNGSYVITEAADNTFQVKSLFLYNLLNQAGSVSYGSSRQIQLNLADYFDKTFYADLNVSGDVLRRDDYVSIEHVLNGISDVYQKETVPADGHDVYYREMKHLFDNLADIGQFLVNDSLGVLSMTQNQITKGEYSPRYYFDFFNSSPDAMQNLHNLLLNNVSANATGLYYDGTIAQAIAGNLLTSMFNRNYTYLVSGVYTANLPSHVIVPFKNRLEMIEQCSNPEHIHGKMSFVDFMKDAMTVTDAEWMASYLDRIVDVALKKMPNKSIITITNDDLDTLQRDLDRLIGDGYGKYAVEVTTVLYYSLYLDSLLSSTYNGMPLLDNHRDVWYDLNQKYETNRWSTLKSVLNYELS